MTVPVPELGDATVPTGSAIDSPFGKTPEHPSYGRPSAQSWHWRLLSYGAVAGLSLTIILADGDDARGVTALVLMIVLLFMKVPVAVATIVPSLLAIFAIYGWEIGGSLASKTIYNGASSWSLSVVAMFIFMGLLLWRSGITREMYDAVRVAFNRVPAPLATGTNIASGGLAAITGSTVGITYAIARIGLPEMLRAGYDKRFAAASVMTGGMAGQLIPPSIMLVIYAGVAQVPVGPQLLAGVVPGVAMILLHAVAITGLALVFPRLTGGRKANRESRARIAAIPFRTKVSMVVRIWPLPVILVLVVGGMFSGVLTATEAGAAGAALSMVLVVARLGRDSWKAVNLAVFGAAASTAAVIFMVLAAEMLTIVITETGMAQSLVRTVTESGLGGTEVILIMLVVYLIMGAFGETLVAVLITVPILIPLFPELGIDPIWFGVFVVICVELGMITPPVGILPFVVHNIARSPEVNHGQRITLGNVYSGAAWLIPVSIALIILLIIFPEIATWLPSVMN